MSPYCARRFPEAAVEQDAELARNFAELLDYKRLRDAERGAEQSFTYYCANAIRAAMDAREKQRRCSCGRPVITRLLPPRGLFSG